MEIAEFLLARIAEDEAMARVAGVVNPPPWTVADEPHPWGVGYVAYSRLPDEFADLKEYGDRLALAEGTDSDGGFDRATAEHIARHDPARVLADCEAKRRILAELDFEDFYLSDISERVATALALPYADHSDYQQRWKY